MIFMTLKECLRCTHTLVIVIEDRILDRRFSPSCIEVRLIKPSADLHVFDKGISGRSTEAKSYSFFLSLLSMVSDHLI